MKKLDKWNYKLSCLGSVGSASEILRFPFLTNYCFQRYSSRGPRSEKNWQLLWDITFEIIGKIIFQVMLIALSVNPQHSAVVDWSTG